MLPESDKLRPRPVFARYLHRMLCEEWGVEIGPPTDDEIRDAFLALAEPAPSFNYGMPDPVEIEAMLILEESL